MHKKGEPVFDLIGQRFGRLVVLEFVEIRNHMSYWKCKCDCGNEKITCVRDLRSGNSKSCGCLARESRRERNRTHSLSKTKVYKAWQGMKDRCSNPKNSHFKYYGGRDIKVCDRWLHSFENFHEDMGSPPTQKHSLDRIDNDGNYSPENCRWATKKEQSNNRKVSALIEHNGKIQNARDWGKELNISPSAVWARFKKGLSIEEVLFVGKFHKNIPNSKRCEIKLVENR